MKKIHSQLRPWGSDLVVLGLNSGEYDLKVLRPYWPQPLDGQFSGDESVESSIDFLFGETDEEMASFAAAVKRAEHTHTGK